AAAADGGGAGGRSLLTPAVLTGLAVIASLVTAHFAAYTYVRPVLEEYTGIGPAAIAFLLLVYGVFGLAGNFAAGALAARRARATVLVLRSEEHTLNSSHVKISYAVFCLKKKKMR